MNNHYFKNDPNLKHDEKEITSSINGILYRFYTDSGVFSKDKLDQGSLILINALDMPETTKDFLDLGCGYGPIGIVVKKTHPNLHVVQTDVNSRAVELCKKNALLNNIKTNCYESDGFENIDGTFDFITLNPPIRAGKIVIFKLYEDAYKSLNNNGQFWIVIRKQQGALSHIKVLEEIFDNVSVVTKSKGYFVVKCSKTK